MYISSLSIPRQKFVRRLLELNYGRIENLSIQNGVPVVTSETRIQKNVCFGGNRRLREDARLTDFTLKTHYIEMFEKLDSAKNGTVNLLQIQNGLPVFMRLEETSNSQEA